MVGMSSRGYLAESRSRNGNSFKKQKVCCSRWYSGQYKEDDVNIVKTGSNGF